MRNRIIAFSVVIIILTTCTIIPAAASNAKTNSSSPIPLPVVTNGIYPGAPILYVNQSNWGAFTWYFTATYNNTRVYAVPKLSKNEPGDYYVYAISDVTTAGLDNKCYEATEQNATAYSWFIYITEDYRYNGIDYKYGQLRDDQTHTSMITITGSPYVKVVNSLADAFDDYANPTVEIPYLVPDQQEGQQIYNTLTENITYRAYSTMGNVYAVLLKNIANLGDRPFFYSMDDIVGLYLRRPSGNYSVNLNTLPNTATNGMHYYLFNPTDTNSTCQNSYIPIIDCNNQAPDYEAICNYLIQYTRSSMSYALPPGNVIYIEVPQNQVISYTLKTTMPKKSSWSTGSWASSQCITYKTSLPDAGTEFPGLIEPFKWDKDPNGKYDAFNSTYDAIYQKTNEATISNYLMIYNPTYFGDSGIEVAATQNNSVYITIDKAISVHVYQLKTGIADGIDGVVDISTSNGTSWTGIPDYQTHEWDWTNDQTGQPEDPTYGGQNIISNSADNFSSWLKNTLNTISEFFTSGHEAILSLTNAVGNFVGSLKSLYLWLPTPVYSLLTSAIMIAITIGVIKIFV